MLTVKDISIVITGAAGQGVKTVEELLVGILKMSGYHVFATKEYESRVRGGTNSTELRISSAGVTAFVKRIDLLIPLSMAAYKHVEWRTSAKTRILADPSLDLKSIVSFPEHLIEMPFLDIAKEIGNKIYFNVVTVGAIAGLFNANLDIGKTYLSNRFQQKGDLVVQNNHKAFLKGYELGQKTTQNNGIQYNLIPNEQVSEEILFNGNEAVALGAIAGGCNFISAYPMSPSTGVLQFLAKHSKDFGIVIDQAEDEIAGINKALGAWYAGARAIASTSGGGFALMTEGLSLAGITEIPVVVHIAQRPGPATGLPTRTGQEDLNLALYAGHGEFPRIIFTPGTIQQAFYLTQKAFNLADQFQIPVFVLTDQDFVDRYYNIPSLDLSEIEVQKRWIRTEKEYKRYQLTDSGISPRGIPGVGEGLVRIDSDEHDEFGHITEDMHETRLKMIDKRLFKKRKAIKSALELPTWIGPSHPKVAVICWGSTYHVVEEAIQMLGRQDVAMVHFQQVYPLHPQIKSRLELADKLISLENNATGQFANVLNLYADIEIPRQHQFLKYIGEPYMVEEVMAWIQKECEN